MLGGLQKNGANDGVSVHRGVSAQGFMEPEVCRHGSDSSELEEAESRISSFFPSFFQWRLERKDFLPHTVGECALVVPFFQALASGGG